MGILLFGIFKPSGTSDKNSIEINKIIDTLDNNIYKIIRNFIYQNGNEIEKIDFIIISVYGIFVLNSVYCRGWVHGSEDDKVWSLIYKVNKRMLKNPVSIVLMHKEVLEEILSPIPDLHYIPAVVFSDKAELELDSAIPNFNISQLDSFIKSFTEIKLDIKSCNLIGILLSAIDMNKGWKKGKYERIISKRSDFMPVPMDKIDRREKIKQGICPCCGGILAYGKRKKKYYLVCGNYPKCRFRAVEKNVKE